MFEYAISAGEGTLVDFGTATDFIQYQSGDMEIGTSSFNKSTGIKTTIFHISWCPAASPYTLIAGPCNHDCVTGQ